MRKRRRMPRKGSKKQFRAGSKVNVHNMPRRNSRGGIRF